MPPGPLNLQYIIPVPQGGTGRTQLAEDEIVLGNGKGPLKTTTLPDLGLEVGTDIQAFDADLLALANQSQTSTFPVRTGDGTISETPYVEGTFTPTVTLVGGAGNTVPIYSTNEGRYTRIGNRVFVKGVLANDGGAEGAGTGTFTIALPIPAIAGISNIAIPCGQFINGATVNVLYAVVTAGASTFTLRRQDTISTAATVTGVDQNNTTRVISFAFFYEV